MLGGQILQSFLKSATEIIPPEAMQESFKLIIAAFCPNEKL